MHVILFVGHHKVGSTALQRYLAQNAPALARGGILYPVVTEPDLTRLQDLVTGGAAVQPLSRNVTEAHNALAFSMISDVRGKPVPSFHKGLPDTDAMFALIRRQCEIFRPDTLILASEVFTNFPSINPGLIERLQSGLDLGRADLDTALYLRRVDDYLMSWHGQRIRFGQKIRPLPEAVRHYVRSHHFDYRRIARGWRDLLPGARLTIASYDAARLAGGTARHFMAQYGLPLPNPDSADKQVNKSIHRGLVEFARRANHDLEPDPAHTVFTDLLKCSLPDDFPASTDIELFGPEARALLLRRFRGVADWVNTTAGHDVFDDLETLGMLRPVPEHDANRAAQTTFTGLFNFALSKTAKSYLKTVDITQNY